MLTGRQRYRLEKRFLRPPLLVLQVEYSCRVYDMFGGTNVLRWRDAAAEDLLTIPAAIRTDFPLEKTNA